ncbi:pyridoxal-dependent decarboxylase [Moorena sp. SIO3B2]|uniref:pyridoxal-dependent decarboxylase n=1 Tax=Moorena sp. SIO3B2 TaxID=2607827 RepID=UPI0025797868|nr:pyridoxal-dependent decarboxylase [Moorena sp. SIO3B2]
MGDFESFVPPKIGGLGGRNHTQNQQRHNFLLMPSLRSTLKTVAVFFEEAGTFAYPFTKKKYIRHIAQLGEAIEACGANFRVVRHQSSYLGSGQFSQSWELRDGEVIETGPIKADVIFDKGLFSSDGTIPVLNCQEINEICTNKYKTFQLFSDYSPQTYLVNSQEEFFDALDDIPGQYLEACSSQGTHYIFHDDEDSSYNLGAMSLQCGRKVDALKLWLAWKYYGKSGYEARVDRLFELASYAADYIRSCEKLQLIVQPTFLNICFRYNPRDNSLSNHGLDQLNLEIRDQLMRSGQALVNYSHYQEQILIRFILSNPNINEADLDSFFANFIKIGDSLS